MIKKLSPKFKIGDVVKVIWSGHNGPVLGIIQITHVDTIRNTYIFEHLNYHRSSDERGFSVIENLVNGKKLENGSLLYGNKRLI